MQRIATLSAAAAVFFGFSPAIAQAGFPTVYVSGEAEAPEMRACRVTYASAIATVEAAFRANRISIGQRDDYIRSRAINAYVNLNLFPLTHDGGRATGTCAVAVELDLQIPTMLTNPVTGARHFAPIVFCDRAYLLTGGDRDLQQRINAVLRDYVSECITRYNATLEP